MGADPEGLQFALLDGNDGAEIENRIRPPTDVINGVGWRFFRFNITDGVDLDIRRRIDFMGTIFEQRRQADGDVGEVAMQRHDGDLQRLVFVLRERDGAFGGTADGDRHVFRKDFLHASGDADEHVARVKPGLDAGIREGDDGDGTFEHVRYAFQFISGCDDVLRCGLRIA